MKNISYFSSSINLQAMLELSGMVLYFSFDALCSSVSP